METHSSFVTVDDEKTLNTVPDSSSSRYSMIPFNTFGVALAVKHPSFSISCQNADRHRRLYTSFLVHRITFLPRWLDRKTISHRYFKCILERVTTKRGLFCLWCAELLDLAGKTFFFSLLLLSILLYELNWIVFHFRGKKGPRYMYIYDFAVLLSSLGLNQVFSKILNISLHGLALSSHITFAYFLRVLQPYWGKKKKQKTRSADVLAGFQRTLCVKWTETHYLTS